MMRHLGKDREKYDLNYQTSKLIQLRLKNGINLRYTILTIYFINLVSLT